MRKSLALLRARPKQPFSRSHVLATSCECQRQPKATHLYKNHGGAFLPRQPYRIGLLEYASVLPHLKAPMHDMYLSIKPWCITRRSAARQEAASSGLSSNNHGRNSSNKRNNPDRQTTARLLCRNLSSPANSLKRSPAPPKAVDPSLPSCAWVRAAKVLRSRANTEASIMSANVLSEISTCRTQRVWLRCAACAQKWATESGDKVAPLMGAAPQIRSAFPLCRFHDVFPCLEGLS